MVAGCSDRKGLQIFSLIESNKDTSPFMSLSRFHYVNSFTMLSLNYFYWTDRYYERVISFHFNPFNHIFSSFVYFLQYFFGIAPFFVSACCLTGVLVSPTSTPHPLPLVRVDQYFPCSLSLMWNLLFIQTLLPLHKDLDGTAPELRAAQVTSRHGHATLDTLLDFYLFGKRLRQIRLLEEGMSREDGEQQEG